MPRISRQNRPKRPLAAESLEPRQVLAVAVASALPDLVIPVNSPTLDQTISLAGRYNDTAVTGTVVRFDAKLGSATTPIFAELFDQAGPGRTRTTPLTAANFLAYANAGDYRNTIIHRSVPGFVVQGGGFKVTDSGTPLVADVPQRPAVVNEPGNTNVRGTIAMAKEERKPNSATNSWFFNLANNAANLDSQNGGFTAFARVLGSGMTVVDRIAALPVYPPPPDTGILPVQGTVGSAGPARENLVTFPSIVTVGELVYSVTTSNAAVVSPSFDGNGSLQLAFAARTPGVATVTVRAESVFNPEDAVEDSFIVRLESDVIIGQSGNELIISRSGPTGPTTAALATLPANRTWTSTMLTGDFSGDGLTDVANRAADGSWWVTKTPASGTATPTRWGSFSASVPWQSFVTGDFDGDGRADIAARNPSTGAWRVARSTGSAFANAVFGTWSTAERWTSALTGDFNGDGKTDIAGRRASDGSWWVSRSTGSSSVLARWGEFTTSVSWQFIVAGDFNGDGKTDIAGHNSFTGAWQVARSTGTAFTNSAFGQWYFASKWTSVLTGDFNGDGKTDIAGRRANDGTWWVSQSTGTSSVLSRWGGFRTDIAWQSPVAGDFNGDGRTDIATRNPYTGAWVVASSSGAAFTATAFGNWPTAKRWTIAVAARA
jgi:cyclophilin family peptidyl-prolyl cis-trans isomerase